MLRPQHIMLLSIIFARRNLPLTDTISYNCNRFPTLAPEPLPDRTPSLLGPVLHNYAPEEGYSNRDRQASRGSEEAEREYHSSGYRLCARGFHEADGRAIRADETEARLQGRRQIDYSMNIIPYCY